MPFYLSNICHRLCCQLLKSKLPLSYEIINHSPDAASMTLTTLVLTSHYVDIHTDFIPYYNMYYPSQSHLLF